jgi:hypothetical protein
MAMAKLSDKIKTALDETRMLMLGSQILLGFQYRSVFEPGFERLPASSQYLKLLGLTLILIVSGLLMAPGSYHRIVFRGEERPEVHSFTSRMMDIALMPFAVALAIDVYVATGKLAGGAYGAVVGIAFAITALFFWYVLELARRPQRAAEIREEREMERNKEASDSQHSSQVKDKINQALTEARVVLPGAQALLGFQFATMLMDGFDKLPLSSKYVHLASLLLMAISIILLMTPAAYHRIVEKGEETEHFHRVASCLLLAAMVPLPIGISGDFFVVLRKVTESTSLAVVAAGLILLFFYGLWFGFTLYQRGRRPRTA